VNFGYVFGMWWKRFKGYARDQYGVILTDLEAQQSRIAFFDKYNLEPWHRNQQGIARTQGFVRTLTGRRRRLPAAMNPRDPWHEEALRQAINAPVQGFCAELNMGVLIQAASEFPREFVRPLITVHDSCIFEVHKTWVSRVANRLEEIVRWPKLLDDFEIDFTVPIEGDVKIGTAWGNGVSLKDWLADNGRIKQIA